MTKRQEWRWQFVFMGVVVGLGVVISASPRLPHHHHHHNISGFEEEPEYALSSQERSFRQSKYLQMRCVGRPTRNMGYATQSMKPGTPYTPYHPLDSRSQCLTSGGLALGNCAQGLGVCCRFIAQCGNVIVHNGTSFQSPNYPSKYTPSDGSNVCQVRIRRPANVCQLRLNFISLEIDGPMAPPSTGTGTTTNNDAGACKTDSLAITASGGTVPNLCGNLNGQHIYVDYGTSDTITLNLLLSGTVQRERVWNIEVLFIPCTSLVRAPSGCLQYFTGISGSVQSFNFQGGIHLANQDYSVCVRPEDGMRFIDWTPCSPGKPKANTSAASAYAMYVGDVRISGVTAAATMPMACTGAGLVDYLTIMGGVSYPLPTTLPVPLSPVDRFCDMTWPPTVTSAYVRSPVRPFILHFRTDSTEVAQAAGGTTEASAGFCLRWQQNPQ